MKKALVAGLGIQGVAIAYAMKKLGYDVKGIENFPKALDFTLRFMNELNEPISAIQGDALSLFDSEIIPFQPDILISALPFNFNFELAKKCIDNRIRYCDLGGNIDTADKINSYAASANTVPVMTDLGLAPGIANIIAEIGYSRLNRVKSVKIRVGGLPLNPKGTLKYGLLFSLQGLYNEYAEGCIVIRDGKKQIVKSLTDIEHIDFPELGTLEAFNTSGGIASSLDAMLGRGVTECDYKTLRFPGHVQYINFLIHDCKLDLNKFSEAIMNACEYTAEDQTLMYIELQSESGQSWKKFFRILCDNNFSAMQKTTGFGAAAVAAIMGDGKMDHIRAGKYADVPHYDFIQNLTFLIPEINPD